MRFKATFSHATATDMLMHVPQHIPRNISSCRSDISDRAMVRRCDNRTLSQHCISCLRTPGRSQIVHAVSMYPVFTVLRSIGALSEAYTPEHDESLHLIADEC